jgi:predicted nucleic acid-binding protein
MTVLVDSDILFEVFRARDVAILERWVELSGSDGVVLCSAVSIAELWHGARANEHTALTNLLGTFSCVPVDEDAARVAGGYLSHYHKSHGLELGDALIAAAAAAHNASLWTRNRKHYPMKGLKFF